MHYLLKVLLDDMCTQTEQKLAFGPGTVASAASAASSGATAASAATAKCLETVEQMRSPVYQAKSAGFVEGTFVAPGPAEGAIWKIVKYDGTAVTVQRQAVGVAVGAPESVESDETMKTWSIHKGSVTALVREKAEDGTFGNPLDNPMWKFHCATGAINLAIKEVLQYMDVCVPLVQLYIKPKSAMATHSWSAGELALAPAAYRIERIASATGIPCGQFELGGPSMRALYISPMFTPLYNAKSEPSRVLWVCPF